MSDLPVRTEQGRIELLERKVLSDSRLRSLLAQCDGRVELTKLRLRFAALMDVDSSLDELVKLGLVAWTRSAESSAATPEPEVLAASQVTQPEPLPPQPASLATSTPETAAPGSDDELSWFPKSWSR